MRDTIEAGVSKMDITPPEELYEGIHDPLYAKALYLNDGRERIAVVVCDMLGFMEDFVAEVKGMIQAKTGLPPAQVMLAATQNHGAPNTLSTTDNRTPPGNEACTGWLSRTKRSIVESVVRAGTELRPVRIGVGEGEAPGIGGNRLVVDRNGQAHGIADDLSGIEVADWGVEYHQVGVMRIEDLDGRLIAVLFSYRCHPNCAWRTRVCTADYPGQACRTIGQAVGADVIPIFLNGPCGDITPWKYMQTGREVYTGSLTFTPDVHTPKAFAEVARMGDILGREALKVLAGITATHAGPIRSVSKRIGIPFKRETGFSPSDVELQAMAIGNHIAWVGIPADYFVDFELYIKKNSPFSSTFVLAHTNGWIGYLPTKKTFGIQGYIYMRDSNWNRCPAGVGERLADAAVELLKTIGL